MRFCYTDSTLNWVGLFSWQALYTPAFMIFFNLFKDPFLNINGLTVTHDLNSLTFSFQSH